MELCTAALQHVCAEMFGVDANGDADHSVSIAMRSFGDRGVSCIANRGAALRVERSARRISSDHRADGLVVGVCLAGSVSLETRTSTIVNRPGELLLAHTAEPHRATLQPGTRIGLLAVPDWLSRRILGAPLVAPPSIMLETASVGAIASGFIASLVDGLTGISDTDWEAVTPPMVHLLAAVTDRGRPSDSVRVARRVVDHRRVLRFIAAHLRDPRLRPGWIAEQLRFSRRYLHLLFEDSGSSVGETILARRLERCRTDLRDPRLRDRSVCDIAFAWGFNDAAHFSRTFRRAFGISPRDART
jgi:AraC-like DNA-binding protein